MRAYQESAEHFLGRQDLLAALSTYASMVGALHLFVVPVPCK